MPNKGMKFPLRGRPITDFWRADENGCWLWTGGNDGRYGMTMFQRVRMKAHRRAWIEANGPIPDGLHVLHHCDVSLCVNPDHLWLGTHTDNMRDKEAKGRGNHLPRQKTCHRGHTDWYERPDRPGKRQCRECGKLRERGLL